MEKAPLREEEIKELEEEIDLAVDRLFIEKRKEKGETLEQGPTRFEPSTRGPSGLEPSPADMPSLEPLSLESEPLTSSFESPLDEALSQEGRPEEPEKDFGFERPIPASPPPSYLKSIDQLEAQLLALEWEITAERLQNTEQAVKSLGLLVKQRNDVVSILGFMEDILRQMMANEEKIRPPMMTFLLDAKETIKLLLRKETDGELTLYKRLALAGMEARFAALQEREAPAPSPPAPAAPAAPETKAPDVFSFPWKEIEEKMEGLMDQWKPFWGEAGATLRRIERYLSVLERARLEPAGSPGQEESSLWDITIFETFGRCYGVESQKILKLLKVPSSFEEKYGHYSRVRLKNLEVSLIDLKKAFPGESWNRGEAPRLIIVHEGDKGLIVEKILKRIRRPLEEQKGDKSPVLGLLRWKDQSHPVEVPVLDFDRM